MFNITQGKGFQITFENGCTVSIQFGTGNYCEKRSFDAKYGSEKLNDMWESPNAEIAAWDKDNNWHCFGQDTVEGHQSPEQVLAFINQIYTQGIIPQPKQD